jgi:hypothetical protein
MQVNFHVMHSKFLGNRTTGGNHFRQTVCPTHFLDANGIFSLDTNGKRLHKSREEYISLFLLFSCKLDKIEDFYKGMAWPAASQCLFQAFRRRLNSG